jgi:hypothetical protein
MTRYNHTAHAIDHARGAFTGARNINGVLRWDSNGQCPMDDTLDMWLILGLVSETEVDATNKARDRETAAFMAQYRRAQAARTPEQVAEHRAELLAAFGPGETVVDMLTGERTVL